MYSVLNPTIIINQKYDPFASVKGLGLKTMLCIVCLSMFLWNGRQ